MDDDSIPHADSQADALGYLAGQVTESLERCFISHNRDYYRQEENVVDAIDRAATNLRNIADAISPSDAAPYTTPDGGRVDSLTEAVIYAAQGLTKIAGAISDLASAVRERDS